MGEIRLHNSLSHDDRRFITTYLLPFLIRTESWAQAAFWCRRIGHTKYVETRMGPYRAWHCDRCNQEFKIKPDGVIIPDNQLSFLEKSPVQLPEGPELY